MDTYKSINLGEWTKVGEGGNGCVYENPATPDVILKVNNARLSTFEAVKHEYEVSKKVPFPHLSRPARPHGRDGAGPL